MRLNITNYGVMKNNIILTLLGVLLFFPAEIKAQNSTDKIKIHKVWITMVDGSKVKGNLYSASKEGVTITKSKTVDINQLRTISFKDIHVIEIRRNGKVLKGMLTGGLIGVGASVLLGATSSSDNFFTQEETILISSILFVPLGTGIGALAGTKKENFNIGGDLKRYQMALKKIQSYSVLVNTNDHNW